MKKTTSLLSLSLMAAIQLAASGEQNLEGITIQSDLFKNTQSKAPYATEVYTQEEIEESKARTLYEFFNIRGLVTAMPNSGNPYSQKLDMRGYGLTDGFQNIVVTVNGRKLNNMDLTSQILSTIPVEAIQQIEIIKGSSAVLQGDGATAGSINIITKKESQFSIGAEIASYDTRTGFLSGGYYGEEMGFDVALKTNRSAGSREIDTSGNLDERQINSASFGVSYYPKEWLMLEADIGHQDYDVRYANAMTEASFNDDPSGLGADPYSLGYYYSRQQYYSQTRHIGADIFPYRSFEINVDYFTEHKDSKSPENFLSYFNYDIDQLRTSVQYKHDGFKAAIGMDRQQAVRDSDYPTFTSYNSEMTKENTGYFLKAAYTFDRFTLEGGYRTEQVDYTYKTATNEIDDDKSEKALEVGLSVNINPSWNLFTSYSEAFQTPDVDRFFTYDFTLSAYTFNGFIDTMKTKTYQIGANYTQNGFKFSPTLFYIIVNDEIYYDSSLGTGANTNLDKTVKKGLELSAEYFWNTQWQTYGTYAYTSAIIEESRNGLYDKNDLPAVSNHTLNFGIRYLPVSHTSLSLNHAYRSKAYAESDMNNIGVHGYKAYNSTDFGVSHQMFGSNAVELYANVTNLFDQKNGHWLRHNTGDDLVFPINYERTYALGVKAKF